MKLTIFRGQEVGIERDWIRLDGLVEVIIVTRRNGENVQMRPVVESKRFRSFAVAQRREGCDGCNRCDGRDICDKCDRCDGCNRCDGCGVNDTTAVLSQHDERRTPNTADGEALVAVFA